MVQLQGKEKIENGSGSETRIGVAGSGDKISCQRENSMFNNRFIDFKWFNICMCLTCTYIPVHSPKQTLPRYTYGNPNILQC
jgi:hypothetical protein